MSVGIMRSLGLVQAPRGKAGLDPGLAAPIVLVVGENSDRQLPPGVRTLENAFHFVGIEQVGAELIGALGPDIVLSPLVTRSFDCIDLAQILSATGFRGSYRVVTPDLPSPDLVRREIRALCPGLSFDLMILAADGTVRF